MFTAAMQDATPSWSDLIGLVGRLVRVTPCSGAGATAVPLIVADVSDRLDAGDWSAFTVSLVGAASDRLSHPGAYVFDVDQRRFSLTLSWDKRQQPHQHYLATLVQPVAS